MLSDQELFLKIRYNPFVFIMSFLLKQGVAKVIDGDTIVSDGGEKVRYLGINAPEIRVRYGDQ